MNNHIICPHCRHEIEISEALRHQIQEEVSGELAQKHKQELDQMKKKTEELMRKRLEEEVKTEQEDLKRELEEKNKRLSEFRGQELELRRKTRQLEEEKREMALEVEKRLNEEKRNIEDAITKRIGEEHRLKELEKEKIINDLKKALEDAQRKASQGSQQLQGEILELDVEGLLHREFPSDIIEPVEKGIQGADIRHIVKSKNGTTCGVILWELKRTKAWSDGWITKLKEDLRAEKANVPVIVSTVLPKEIESGLGLKDGVWICSFSFILPLALLIRQRLWEVAYQKAANVHRGDKASMLYDYVTGHEFKQQVEALVEIYTNKQNQIHKERIVFEKSWKARESENQKLLLSIASIYGSMQGLAGNAMPRVEGLEIEALESGE